MITLANRQELTILPLVHAREQAPLIFSARIPLPGHAQVTRCEMRATTRCTCNDLHLSAPTRAKCDAALALRSTRSSPSRIFPHIPGRARLASLCLACGRARPAHFWLAYVSTYDVGLVLASSPTHAGSPILCLACMYNWPLPLHTRASSTSRACDSARLTHSARTREQANLHLVTHIRASTPCTHHWHRQQRATRIFGLHVRATEAYMPCPHTRKNTR